MLNVTKIDTHPCDGQKPGPSGLRKRVTTFLQENYTENFIQSILNANKDSLHGSTLVVGGNGRYPVNEVVDKIIKICAANGVRKLLVGRDGILSTPAVSCIIRKYNALGGIVLTASHNPDDVDNDFGIKFNCNNGGPAPDNTNNRIYELTTSIQQYRIVPDLVCPVDKIGRHTFKVQDRQFVVEVIDSVRDYVDYMKAIFDFPRIEKLIRGSENRKPFKVLIDSMNGVTGPYVRRIFISELRAPEESMRRVSPLQDFDGAHTDPNQTYAADFIAAVKDGGFDFGAAFDGDGDRNMIFGRDAFSVTPSDSLAVLADNLHCIPYFSDISCRCDRHHGGGDGGDGGNGGDGDASGKGGDGGRGGAGVAPVRAAAAVRADTAVMAARVLWAVTVGVAARAARVAPALDGVLGVGAEQVVPAAKGQIHFWRCGGPRGAGGEGTAVHCFARSMHPAAALDRVAAKNNKSMYKVPTDITEPLSQGWKYFGNLMDAGQKSLFGVESFGTGSDQVWENDGIWAVLAWLSVLAWRSKSVEETLKAHWDMYGRNYFTRYDYEKCASEACNEMMQVLVKKITAPEFVGSSYSSGNKTYVVQSAENFSHVVPIDHNVTRNQGLRIMFEDGSRIVLRLSGTRSSGTTVRLFIDSYEAMDVCEDPQVMLKPLFDVALSISQLQRYTGRDVPTIIM